MFIKPAKKIITSFLFLAVSTFWISAQEPDRNVEQRLKDFFTNFETSYANIGKCRLDRYELNHSKKALHVYANANFGYQPFTPENTEAIYRLLKQSLPGPVNYYDITIYADGKPIEELIPNILQKKQDKSRLWQRIDYKGAPWIQNMSRPYLASKGLEGRHIALWQSHGKYYKNNKVRAYSAPQKTSSHSLSSFLISSPCWKTPVPSSIRHANETGSATKL